MAYSILSLVVNDSHCSQAAEVRCGADGGYVEFRYRGDGDSDFGEWVQLSDDFAVELAAALLIASHFCNEDNQVLRNAAPVQDLTRRLAAKICGASA